MTVTVSSPVFSKNASFVKVVISRNLGTSGQRFSNTEYGKSAHSHWQTVWKPAASAARSRPPMPENRLTWVRFFVSVVVYLRFLSFGHSFAVDKVPLPAAAGIGVAGQQRDHILAGDDQDLVYLMGINDLFTHHFVG